MTDPDSRAEFEKWAADQWEKIGTDMRMWVHGNGEATAWAAWQAARRTLPQGYAAGLADAAKLVRGEPYKEHYRHWPTVWPIGNVSNESEIAQRCDTLAAAILSLTPSPDAGVVEKKR